MAPLADFQRIWSRNRLPVGLRDCESVTPPPRRGQCGGLAIARVPSVRYLKWVAPLLLFDPDIAEYGGTEHR